MEADFDLLRKAYRRFNVRDLEGVLEALHPEVDWPNAMEGGRIHGREAMREYWTRQWLGVDPHVEPVGFREEDGQVVVSVRQVVRSPRGEVLINQMVEHVYTMEDGLVRRMEIRELAAH